MSMRRGHRRKAVEGLAQLACYVLGAAAPSVDRLRNHLSVLPPGHLTGEALQHGIACLAHVGLRQLGLEALDKDGALADAYWGSLRAHLRTLAEVERLGHLFDDSAIPWLVLKGPILAEKVYPSANLRPYSDLDLLVPAGSFRAAVEVLEAAGGTLLDREWNVLLAQSRAQLHLRTGRGCIVDLHWHVLNRGHVRRGFAIDIGHMLDRQTSVEIDGRMVPTLNSADTLAYLCLHAGVAGGSRLLWLLDVHLAAQRLDGPAAWAEFVATVSRWRARAITGVVLRRAMLLFRTQVPSRVLEALQPPAALRPLVAVSTIMWPGSRLGTRSALPTLLIRDTAVETIRAARARLRERGEDAAWAGAAAPGDQQRGLRIHYLSLVDRSGLAADVGR